MCDRVAADDPTNPASYHFATAEKPHTAHYLYDPVIAICRRLGARRVLDLGCGNGAFPGALSEAGFDVVGCDPSEEGVAVAKEKFPRLDFHRLGVYDNPSILGRDFDAVVSMEVVEHLHSPRMLPRFVARVLRPDGQLILTTPYHGYLKNLVIAASGKWDGHHSPLWDGGHVKFWSRATLTMLLSEEGFSVREFEGAGRIPFLWKSMILTAQLTR